MTELSQSRSEGPPGAGGEFAGPSTEPEPQRRTWPPTSAGWGPTEILMGIGLFLVLLLVGSAIAQVADGSSGGDQRSGTLITLQAFTAIAFVLSAFLVVGPARATLGKLGLGRTLAKRVNLGELKIPAPLAYGIAAIVIYGAFSLVLGALIHPEQDDIPDNLGYDSSTIGNVAIGFLIVIAAPISEEIFFRGFMFAGIRSRANIVVAALISSIFWGALHFTGSDSWGAVAQLSVFGLVLCWTYEKTGSVRTTIAIHALNNAIAFAYLVS